MNATTSQATPPAMAATRRPLLDRMLDIVFGYRSIDESVREVVLNDPADAVQVERRSAKPPRGETLLNALAQAIGEFHYNEVRPYRKYSPRFCYQLFQLVIIRTPDSMGLLADFERMRREQRNLILRARLSEFDGFDLSEFSDVRFEDAGSSATDPIYVMAGDGPLRTRLCVEFHGEFVEMPETSTQAVTGACAGVAAGTESAPSQTPTLLVGPRADVVPLTVDIQEPGLPPRSLELTALPARIGRAEDCEVVLLTPFVSRQHLLLESDPASGGLRITDRSRVGSLLDGQRLPSGQSCALPEAAVLTLAPDAGDGAVTLRLQRRALAPSQTQTLLPTARSGDRPTTLAGAGSTDAGLPLQDLRPLPLARLRVCCADGRSTVHDVTDLPFEIGRQPETDEDAQRCRIDGAHGRVRRLHLRIVRRTAGVFELQNLAHDGNGSWVAGERMPERFTLKPEPAASQGGWCVLGERNLSPLSVAIRLEVVR